MINDLVFLSVFQGISEFLPISSNGHMVVLEQLFGINSSGFNMHVVLHFGSLLALLIYFSKDICLMIFGIWIYDIKKLKKHPAKRYRDLAFILVLSSIPVMVVGFLVKKYFGTTAESLKIIGIASIFFGALLIVADVNPVKDNFPTYKNGALIGIFQCMAFIPGASRSGTCITAARFCGLGRTEATRFAFLMAIPTILGACTLVALDTHNCEELFTNNQLILMGAIAGLGILTIQSLLWFLKKFSFISFGIYRIIFGIFLLFFL